MSDQGSWMKRAIIVFGMICLQHSILYSRSLCANPLRSLCASPPVVSSPKPSLKPLPPHPEFGPLPFDGVRAFSHLKRYVDFGQRYYGAPQRAQAIQHIIDDLTRLGLSVSTQEFKVLEKRSKITYTLTNVIGRMKPERPYRVILGTHWDTRLWAEEDQDTSRHAQPITGANDGTSGLAVLLELAYQLTSHPLSTIGVDFIFFDGEEFGRPGSKDYCQGSRYFAKHRRIFYPTSEPLSVIVIDMVGDKELQFPAERSSLTHARALTELVWREAHQLKASAFPNNQVGQWIIDDHTPFQELKIPALLLIDYNYKPWHTHQDTIDQCSAESLTQVGRVLWASLLRLNQSVKKQIIDH